MSSTVFPRTLRYVKTFKTLFKIDMTVHLNKGD